MISQLNCSKQGAETQHSGLLNSSIWLLRKVEQHLTGKKTSLFQYGKKGKLPFDTMKVFEGILGNNIRSYNRELNRPF